MAPSLTKWEGGYDCSKDIGDPKPTKVKRGSSRTKARKLKGSASPDGVITKNTNAFSNRGSEQRELKAKLIMHDDNSAMIQVFRSGKNPTMRTLGRVFGVSLSSMHEMTRRSDFALGPEPSDKVVADISH